MKKSTHDEQADTFDLTTIDFISVMDSLDEGVIITDHSGVIQYYNETQAQICHLPSPQNRERKKFPGCR